MADKTPIEWTDATWNPVIGCRRVDEGCRNCYAEVMAARFSDPGQWGHGLAARVKDANGATQYRWTGATRFIEHALEMPLRWRKPRKIFVCSTSDLFGESVPDEWIDRVFSVMALAPQHTFQVLTKRPERARAYLSNDDCIAEIGEAAWQMDYRRCFDNPHLQPFGSEDDADTALVTKWPLPNVWLGTSISDQASADLRIPELLATPAAVRFISAEPLLGPVNLDDLIVDDGKPGEWHVNALDNEGAGPEDDPDFGGNTIDWVICGGESGPNARPMHPGWARKLRDQCAGAGVAFFMKQWGEWGPDTGPLPDGSDPFQSAKVATWIGTGWDYYDGFNRPPVPKAPEGHEWMYRLGKKQTGALLDDREHREFPNACL